MRIESCIFISISFFTVFIWVFISAFVRVFLIFIFFTWISQWIWISVVIILPIFWWWVILFISFLDFFSLSSHNLRFVSQFRKRFVMILLPDTLCKLPTWVVNGPSPIKFCFSEISLIDFSIFPDKSSLVWNK